jgi:hypothetical protein
MGDSWRVGSGGVGFVVSHLSDKNKNVAKMGHPGFVVWVRALLFGFVISHRCDRRKSQEWRAGDSWRVGSGGVGFVVSHLSDRNKNVAKMGHPGFVVWHGVVSLGSVGDAALPGL